MGLLAERAGNRMGMRQDFAPASEEFDAKKKQRLGI
jgi:hypothetical protein